MYNSKPQVIVVAYHFPPGQEIGGFRPFRFYKYLKRMGYTCHVITADQPSEVSPTDVIYIADEFRPIWEGWSHKRLSLLGRVEQVILKFVFPGHLGITWSLKAAAQCRQIIRSHPRNRFVVFSTYPPLGVLLAGLILRWREKVPWICDFRDPMHVDPLLSNVSRIQLFLNRRLEAWAFRDASAIIANVEPAAAVWRERYPSARQKLHVIYNGFDPEDGVCASEIPPRAEKIVLHAGSLYLGRNANQIVSSLLRLRKRQAPEAASVCLHLVGGALQSSGQDLALMDEAQREGLLKLSPPVSRQEAQRMTAESDGLLLLQPQSKVQVPGKLYDYICIGRPVLALVPRSSAVEEILKEAGTRYVCVYVDDPPDDVDQKLIEFLRLPAEATQYNDWFRDNFNAEYQAGQLSTIIESIL
jgi:glycosyltransferase involved in cell wall biosynthesis